MTTVDAGRETVRPCHVGVVMDGNRRWARRAGLASPSGEQRLSGFFPWQASHAEVHVSPKLWPDFDEAAFDLALTAYAAARAGAGGAAR